MSLSFDNEAWSPTVTEKQWDFPSSRSNDLPNRNTPLATSTPRYHSDATSRIKRRVSPSGTSSQSSPVSCLTGCRPITSSDTSSSLSRDNSQGYQLFYQSEQFSRRGPFSNLRNRFVSLLSSFRSHFSVLEDSVPLPHSFSGVEGFRAGGDSDLINLSEIFPSTEVVNNSQPPPILKEKKRSTRFRKKMGSLYRSEPMKLVQLIFTKDAAYECVGELGRMGLVQFNDLNHTKNLFQRYFVRDTRRCDEVERKLRFLKLQVEECVPRIRLQPVPCEVVEIPTVAEVNQFENRLDELERDFVLLNKNETQLRRNLTEMREFQFVLERVEQFFEIHMEDEAMYEIEAASMDDPFSMSFGSGGGTFSPQDVPLTPLLNENEQVDNTWFVAGVIPQDKQKAFERVLWRACRRTAFVRSSELRLTFEDPQTLCPVNKCAFIVFFKGESLKLIVDKVCDGFQARQYPCPKTSKERQTSLFETIARIQDLSVIIDSTQQHRFSILSDIAEEIPVWFQKVHVQKAIYHTLNMCTVDTNGFLAAECWVPENEMDNVFDALQSGLEASGSDVSPVLNVMETTEAPPTFHRTNKFNRVFQSIVDSYGVASYREVNPAPFTIITFPFLFAVMFGDAAHGLILFLAGLFFIWREEEIISKRVKDEIFRTFFGGRYIMLLMGLFSIYTGCIYNDAFAKSVNVFGSRWLNPYNASQLAQWSKASPKKEVYRILDPAVAFMSEEGPYPFGVDPVWNIADNRLSFLNSMKMKVSVILGVAQMTFGVILSLLNHRFFKSSVDIWTNFVPQIIFLSSIFIYLCVQMIVKWIFFSVHAGTVLGQEYPGSFCAPSLLIGLINMFMFKDRPAGFLDYNGSHHPTCYLNQWYPNQSLVEGCLIGVALVCIPIMLLGKPLTTYWKARSKHNRKLNGAAVAEEACLVNTAKEESHEMGDVVVHQAIHTIEFVLGCVSHTASYLRLWALSLAHAQLSEVLWHMVLMAGMSIGEGTIFSYLVTYLVFLAFAVLSLSILVMMEGLSAFLHALRLHWVEFQSKFYQGLGNAFHPYSLRDALEMAQQQTEIAEIID